MNGKFKTFVDVCESKLILQIFNFVFNLNLVNKEMNTIKFSTLGNCPHYLYLNPAPSKQSPSLVLNTIGPIGVSSTLHLITLSSLLIRLLAAVEP